ncbi:alpha-L-fucosidase isoform X1 [Hydra vulgaris]|uniref:alpha-L-fucosidase isoform X1 n=1 Tax=Hydra vulgaris TaxID=6087 RepID=UPI00019260B2|nr:alpha-L-fucosidase [Hydra vulgaris]
MPIQNFMLVLLVVFVNLTSCEKRYEPSWASLDKHVAPSWYDEGKIGIFMHWGLYSVPSFGTPTAGSEWLWNRWSTKEKEAVDFMTSNYPPNYRYQDFAPQWKAEFFDANEWADIVENSGAKYFVITSKHHEGFTLWPSNVSWNWNSVDCGPHRDLIGELATVFHSRSNVHFGMYYSLFEWFHPLFLLDKANNFKSQEYVQTVVKPQLYDFVNKYKPEYIWSDGDPASSKYWGSEEFIAWLYNDSPVRDNILVNDRWGPEAWCKHGDVKNCADRFLPGKKVDFKWENAMTLDKHSWGNRRNTNLNDYMTMEELLSVLAETISYGGNLLINVGPTSDGRIEPIFQERLAQLGSWLKVNGKAVYSTSVWKFQNDSESGKIWYTTDKECVYAIILQMPNDAILTLHQPIPKSSSKVFMLGSSISLPWEGKEGRSGITVDLTGLRPLPCQWAWSLALIDFE